MKLDIFKLDGSKAGGSVELNADVFGLPVRADLLHRAVAWQLNAKRAGTASTLERSEINRTGKKVYRQKGTGGARHGSKRANLFRGGGITHGPRPRDFATDLPKKVRVLAIKTALSAKLAEQGLVVVDAAAMASHKTKDLNTSLSKSGLTRALFVVDSLDVNFDRASRNLPHVKVIPSEGVNVYDILRHEKVVLTQAAVAMVTERLQARAQKTTTTVAAIKIAYAPKGKVGKASRAAKAVKAAAAPNAAIQAKAAAKLAGAVAKKAAAEAKSATTSKAKTAK